MPLVTSKGTGVVSFKTDPFGVTIYLDGEEYGARTPASINNIPTGEHSYVLRKEGFLDFQGRATVSDSQLCCIAINMTTAKSEETCSTEEVPSYEAPVPPRPAPAPDYMMLAIGLFVGIILVGLFEK